MGDGAVSVGYTYGFGIVNWGSGWHDRLEGLADPAARTVAGGGGGPRYRLDILAVNQHTALPPWRCETGLGDECPGCAAMGADMMSLEEMTAGRTDKGFERVISSEGCQGTLVLLDPWLAPIPI